MYTEIFIPVPISHTGKHTKKKKSKKKKMCLINYLFLIEFNYFFLKFLMDNII